MATKLSWDCRDLADWANGKLISEEHHCQTVSGFSTDSRTIRQGECYIAVKGAHFDGHQFVNQAIEAGAAALIVSQKMDVPIPQILVKDTRLALGRIAEQHRLAQKELILIAVTGSNGKTTVKTMLAHCLAQVAPTWSTPGNLNNDFGVPRTLLQIKPDHRYAVIEMGANHRGEIGYLTRLAHPDVAVITLAAEAHLEGFGSLQCIIDTKGEIFHGLLPQGVGVINRESPGFEQWEQSLTNKYCKSFGASKVADVWVSDIEQEFSKITFVLNFYYQGCDIALPVSMSLLGRHNAMNAAAVASVCLELGMTPEQIQSGLQSFHPVSGRLQTHQFGDVLLIDDSYNANPSSVKAAIDTLAGFGGKTILCLGQMGELGQLAEQAHIEVGCYAAKKGIDYFFGYGDLTRFSLAAYAEQLSLSISDPQAHHVMAEQIMAIVKTAKEPVSILIKGSRSAQMDQVVKLILERMSHADLS